MTTQEVETTLENHGWAYVADAYGANRSRATYRKLIAGRYEFVTILRKDVDGKTVPENLTKMADALDKGLIGHVLEHCP